MSLVLLNIHGCAYIEHDKIIQIQIVGGAYSAHLR